MPRSLIASALSASLPGIIITDERFGDFEVVVEMNNDFGPDSGLFLRSTEDGKAWQAMIDYHAGGNRMAQVIASI